MRCAFLFPVLLAASASAQIPGERARKTTPESLSVVLTVDADRARGPVDVTLDGVNPFDEVVLLNRRYGHLDDGTVVQLDAAPHGKMRLRYLAQEPLAAGDHELTVRFDGEAPDVAFAFDDTPDVRTLRHGDRTVYRFMHAYDPDHREETYKPYHHVFSPDGATLLTKGPGGLYPHHRGVFLGYRQTRRGDDTFDFWHCPNGLSQRWQRPASGDIGMAPRAGAVAADAVEHIAWCDAKGAPVVDELRTVTAWDADPDVVMLDFVCELRTAGDAPITLDGDPQHAGLQFRAVESVHEHGDSATYERSPGAKGGKDDVWTDCDWVACHFAVDGHEFVVQHHAHPHDPGPWRYSTRVYGRFGSFAPAKLEPGHPVVLRHRIAVTRVEDEPHWPPADVHSGFVTPLHAKLAH